MINQFAKILPFSDKNGNLLESNLDNTIKLDQDNNPILAGRKLKNNEIAIIYPENVIGTYNSTTSSIEYTSKKTLVLKSFDISAKEFSFTDLHIGNVNCALASIIVFVSKDIKDTSGNIIKNALLVVEYGETIYNIKLDGYIESSGYQIIFDADNSNPSYTIDTIDFKIVDSETNEILNDIDESTISIHVNSYFNIN